VIHKERNGLVAQTLAKTGWELFLSYTALMALSCSSFREHAQSVCTRLSFSRAWERGYVNTCKLTSCAVSSKCGWVGAGVPCQQSLHSYHSLSLAGITSKQVVLPTTSVPPVNALTLEEVHARENIQPAPSMPSTEGGSPGEGMEAFNKLLAVLESKQSVRS